MGRKASYCSECGWHGEEPVGFEPAQWAEILETLQPGDTAPTGICPNCGANCRSAEIFFDRLIHAEKVDGPEPDAAWEVAMGRVGAGYAFYLIHPLGYGCEVLIEVNGERPSFEFTPFNDRDSLQESEPIALVRVGEDHVAFTHSANASAAVIATEEKMRSCILPPGRWEKIRRWSDTIDVPRPPSRAGAAE